MSEMTKRLAFWTSTALVAAYVLYVTAVRFAPAFAPYVAETDWKQAVWQYYRYYVKGAFPSGQMLTDYAFIYHGQPVYWPLMATLSTFIDPRYAATALNIFAFVGTPVFAYFAVRGTKAGHYAALAAAALIVRDDMFFKLTAGGYARSFGPILVCFFLAAWLNKRRKLTMVALALAAGTYPSVAIPCCLAWGISELYEFAVVKEGRLRRVVEWGITGAAVILLAEAQNLRAPDWWGPVVWYEEAADMAAFHGGQRMPLVPLPAIGSNVWTNLLVLFTPNGPVLGGLSAWNTGHKHVLELALVAIGFGLALVAVRKTPKEFPWRIPLTFAMGFVGYMLVRWLAFKLFIPHRVIAHSWPYIIAIFALASWDLALRTFFAKRSPLVMSAVAAAVVAMPVFFLSGFGVEKVGAYRSYAKDAKLYQWIEKHTPLQAQFAGNLQPMDEIPLFSKRQVYANWKLAHPFRKGYWDAIEKRIVKMYDAYYAVNVDDVLRFADEEKIDYFIVDRTRFEKYERGDGQLFEPLRSEIQPFFDRCKNNPCALNPAPRDAIVFHNNNYDVIDIKKLKKAARDASSATPTSNDTSIGTSSGTPSTSTGTPSTSSGTPSTSGASPSTSGASPSTSGGTPSTSGASPSTPPMGPSMAPATPAKPSSRGRIPGERSTVPTRAPTESDDDDDNDKGSAGDGANE